MSGPRTREQLERRLDELCDQYLKHPHCKEMGIELLDIARCLDELKEGETNSNREDRVKG